MRSESLPQTPKTFEVSSSRGKATLATAAMFTYPADSELTLQVMVSGSAKQP